MQPTTQNFLYKNKYKTNTIRLKNWDYSKDAFYFITICTKNKQNLFGKIENDEMVLNSFGEIIKKYWFEIPKHFENVRLDEFIVMPNHVHGILIIDDGNGGGNGGGTKNNAKMETQQCCVSTNKIDEKIQKSNTFYKLKSGSLPVIIRSYKSICTKTINKFQDNIRFAWQPRFYERIIRNQKEFHNIKYYIINNPANWRDDKNFK